MHAGPKRNRDKDAYKPKPLAAATKNRYLATIKRILTIAQDRDWIAKAPKLSTLEEPKKRVRWEPPSVILKLVEAMTLEWMRDVSLVAVATGMREDELLSMEPKHIDLERRHAWVDAERSKSGYARAVPLNKDAMAILQRRVPHAKKYVFERPPQNKRTVSKNHARKISQVDARCLRAACKRVGITDFTFHDFRHTWASWHVQAGTQLMVLKELGGWESIEMVQKYAHLAQSHLAHHAENVTFTSQGAAEKKKAA